MIHPLHPARIGSDPPLYIYAKYLYIFEYLSFLKIFTNYLFVGRPMLLLYYLSLVYLNLENY